MAKGIAFMVVLVGVYTIGWGSAHSAVAEECRRLNSFYVGQSTFKCMEITNGKSEERSSRP